jgi:glutamyl-tRNA reductase
MLLIGLSFSHVNVPISIREKIFFDEDSIANAYARFRCGDQKPEHIIEIAILSTCNRTEFYLVCGDCSNSVSERELAPDNGALVRDMVESVLAFISESREMDVHVLRNHMRCYFGADVVEYLGRVACGLESLVLGEPQILGQVGDTMRLGLAMNAVGPVLTKLFQTSIRAGRRARHETEINTNSLNVATLAVNSVEKISGSLANKTVVVLGAGEMAELALQQLRKKGVGEIHVVNRTIQRASEVADRYAGRAHVFEQISRLLPEADILLSSTGAPHTLITKTMIEYAMMGRADRSLFIIDIAIPRDVEITVQEIANVHRFDLDDLHVVAGELADLRRREIPSVEKILRDEIDLFLRWYRGVGVESTLIAWRKSAERTRELELERLRHLLPDVDDRIWSVVERFSCSIVNKLLHEPTKRLRDLHGTRHALDYAESIRVLFDLAVQECDLDTVVEEPLRQTMFDQSLISSLKNYGLQAVAAPDRIGD